MGPFAVSQAKEETVAVATTGHTSLDYEMTH